MKVFSVIKLSCSTWLLFALLLVIGRPAEALNNTRIINISESQLKYYLEHPNLATAARYKLKDSAGNSMDCMSVLQTSGQSYKYAAVYHTAYQVTGGLRFKINLAGSNDLINWTYIGILLDNADMPRIAQVTGSTWIVLTHEQWFGAGPTSASPARVSYKLFYNFNDLMLRTVRVSWTAPSYTSDLNGTPSIYEAHLAQYNGNYTVDGQYGFHFWDGSRDLNAVTTVQKLFSPSDPVVSSPSTASLYNNTLIANGVTGSIGQRDTLITTAIRYNIQEGNIGQPGASFDKWRIWLYKFGDNLNYPTGNGTWSALSPITPAGSTSFGNPSITVVDKPTGNGKSIVISYYLFSEGAKKQEAGPLIYYFNL